MAKMKKPTKADECGEAIFPLGKGLPLCMYQICQEGRLADVKLQDIPPCGLPRKCYKEEDKNKEKGDENNGSKEKQ